jgi:hypothetical protein
MITRRILLKCGMFVVLLGTIASAQEQLKFDADEIRKFVCLVQINTNQGRGFSRLIASA